MYIYNSNRIQDKRNEDPLLQAKVLMLDQFWLFFFYNVL